MQNRFSTINAWFDKIYILTLERLTDRIALFKQELEGLNYEVFYGVDKETISLQSMKADGIYNDVAYRNIYSKRADMSAGMFCCSLGHVKMYESILAHGYDRVLILEDDAFPVNENLSLFPAITEALPNDWEVFYLGYEGNETFGWQQKIKRLLYMSFPSHASLHLSRKIYSNYYPRPLSAQIARAGFHDCTHAYAVTREGARKLLQKQTPVFYNADNLLAFAIANDELRGYISRPKLFNQRTAFVHTMHSLTS
ncbi:glycosyltransferase family 25 protein [Paraflavitalea sp. CAU 1676]|uniref:glycosyltransferase family 25 protein n=1 Tax=Paraflavitalea sp. CAU 1676 TaxID=3032598 RepID=UPI0023DCAC2F|nr:glycosyltransferase family 25 protein [Paraflavitalea sp. CAU 1676]MDF2189624.1 glycosyltransferase family 25 protein [Paraflavitalea sp. CAU 1676]